jgi:hypothetical protein
VHRFEREIDVVAKLEHPNIVRLYDRGLTDQGFPYFVMEFIDGVSLDDLIAATATKDELAVPGEGSLQGEESSSREATPVSESGHHFDSSPRGTLRLMVRVCEAVDYAHQHGVIHRDIKPSNIIVDSRGEPHLLDFGLAKRILEEAGAPHTATLSLAGEFMGSLPWASPEQTDGSPGQIDERTDVYSLGVTLFQALTHELPYHIGTTFAEALDNIRGTEPKRPSSLNRQLDDDVDAIMLKCLAKEPDRRYQDAAELGDDLRRYLAGEPIEAKSDSVTYRMRKRLRRHRTTVLLSAAVILVMAIGAGGALWMSRSGYWSRSPAVPPTSPTATGGWRDENGIWHIHENARLQPADIRARDMFGKSTAITAEPDWRILVGAPYHGDVGAVFVYRFDGANWVQETKLLGSPDVERARFGWSLKIDGRTARIGGQGDPSIFEYDGSEWLFRGRLQPPGARFGLYGPRGERAAGFTREKDAEHGTVSVYRREANDTLDDYTDDYWVEEAKFQTSGSPMCSVAAGAVWGTEQTLILRDAGCGAGERGSETVIRASVRVFRQDPSTPQDWRQEAVLVGYDVEPHDRFGECVTMDGDVIVAAAPRKEDYGRKTGAVYVFRFDGQQWIEEAKLLPPGGIGDVLFGCPLALSGDLLLVGAATDSEGAYYAGAVHVYQFDGATWVEKAKLVASNPRPLEVFGVSMVLADDTAVIGANCTMNETTGGVDLGAAYVFRGFADRNGNGELDMIDIASGMSCDRNNNRVPDECEPFPVMLSQNTTGQDADVVLGPPDDRWYEFSTGIVEFDFGDARIVDREGADFNVYEFESGVPEFDLISVLVSEDGRRFVEVGAPVSAAVRLPGDGEQGRDTTRYVRSYDLAGSGLSRIRYVRLEVLGDGYRHDGIGFELDAIGAIHLAPAEGD